MGLFRWNWLRTFVRRHTSPIEMTTAERWKQRLSVMYAILAWNAFGLVIYASYNGSISWVKPGIGEERDTKSIGRLWAKSSGATNAKLIKYKDGKLTTEEFRIDDEEDSV